MAQTFDVNEDGVYTFPPLEDMWDHIDVAMVRIRKPWVDSYSPEQEGILIQLGAGKKDIEGWASLDYPSWDAHSDNPKLWRLPYDDASVAEIASYHTLDHLEPWAVVRTLREIERVLEPQGVFTNIVPHYMGQLANECIMHKSRFAVDTFRNIFSERQYSHEADGDGGEWKLSVGSNFIFGYTERNLVLVTQLIKGE